MAIVVVGGHSQNVGKTSVVCRLLATFPECGWTAIKVSQHEHAETGSEFVAILEEHNRASNTDSSRYLAAGAVRSLWVRAGQEQLEEVMPRIRSEFAHSGNVIIESNSILGFLRPDLYLVVMDASISDFKPSALQHLQRADAILLSGGDLSRPVWPRGFSSTGGGVPVFDVPRPEFWSNEAEQFIRARLALSTPQGSSAKS